MRNIDRRYFLKTSAVFALAASGVSACKHVAQEVDIICDKIMPLAESLLKEWCNTIVKFQVIKPDDLTQHGGIYSLGDNAFLGRCADSVFPLLWMAEHSTDEKYTAAAKLVYSWEQANCSHENGAWLNDPGNMNSWKGITVFGAITKMEALSHYSHLLGEETVEEWKQRTKKAMEWVYSNIDFDFGNINYPNSITYALFLASEMFNEKKYAEAAQSLAYKHLNQFNSENLIWGEGGYCSDKQAMQGVDLGYNVEESLQALAMYAEASNNLVLKEKVYVSLKAHLEFMLPNGAWDNSWGSRNFKWTVWGSRTSDGSQPAYYLMADKNPAFAKAVYQNLICMKESTHEGILTSGYHEHLAGVKPSIHHTFEHAKALAVMLHLPKPKVSTPYILLPREKEYGLKTFNSINTTLFAKGSWSGTVTAYAYNYKGMLNGHCSGGALSCLYHKKMGFVTAASMNEYQRKEAGNMLDEELVSRFMNLTPRLELTQNGEEVFRNITYDNAKIFSREIDGAVVIRTESKLVDAKQNNPKTGEIKVGIEMIAKADTFRMKVETNIEVDSGVLFFYLPIVSAENEMVTRSNQFIFIQKPNGIIEVSANYPMEISVPDGKRVYNFVPGLQALPIQIACNQINGKALEIKLEAK